MKKYSIDKYFEQKKILFLDLDNTLINENTYLFACFENIARYMLPKSKEERKFAFHFLKKEFIKYGREKLYDKFCEKYNLEKEEKIAHFLNIHRTIRLERQMQINLEILDFIQVCVPASCKIYIVTNGNMEQQKNKVQQIAWDMLNREIEKIIYASETEPKPSTKCVQSLMKNELKGYAPQDMVCIGDSYVDQFFAQDLNIDFWHIGIIKEYIKHTIK